MNNLDYGDTHGQVSTPMYSRYHKTLSSDLSPRDPWPFTYETSPLLSGHQNRSRHRVHGILQARILEWVAFPFSRGSSQPRDGTQVSHIAGGFFTSWAIREAQEYWSGLPIPSPADLPNPGFEPGSPALQEDSLPAELWGTLPKIKTSPYLTPKYT